MNNLIHFPNSNPNQTHHWVKMLHDLAPKEALCYFENRGKPRFALRLLSRISGLAVRFSENPNISLGSLHRHATVLSSKNRFTATPSEFLQPDVTKSTNPSDLDLKGISILKPKNRLN